MEDLGATSTLREGISLSFSRKQADLKLALPVITQPKNFFSVEEVALQSSGRITDGAISEKHLLISLGKWIESLTRVSGTQSSGSMRFMHPGKISPTLNSPTRFSFVPFKYHGWIS